MIKHFLGVLFWSFIGLVVFVNLYQMSGAFLPFEDNATSYYESTTYFGFTSILNFTSSLGSNPTISNALKIIGTGFSIIKTFSIDTIVELFTNCRDLTTNFNITEVFKLVASILTIITYGLVQPIVYIFAFAVLILGVLLFVWELLTILFQFLLGYYNATIPVSVIL